MTTESDRDNNSLGALAEALLPGEPNGLVVVAKMAPEKRASYERLLWVADELNAGRVPPGVMI